MYKHCTPNTVLYTFMYILYPILCAFFSLLVSLYLPLSFIFQVPQTTSSILGNPPSNLKYSIPVPISSSILGTAPQLPASIGGPTSQGTMTPPAVMNSAGHPPPPPPPPSPPTMPALINAQPSLLGNLPFHLLVSQTVPSVPPNVPPPNRYQMIFGNQYDSTAPPSLPPLIQNLPNQFSPHPNVVVAPGSHLITDTNSINIKKNSHLLLLLIVYEYIHVPWLRVECTVAGHALHQ